VSPYTRSVPAMMDESRWCQGSHRMTCWEIQEYKSSLSHRHYWISLSCQTSHLSIHGDKPLNAAAAEAKGLVIPWTSATLVQRRYFPHRQVTSRPKAHSSCTSEQEYCRGLCLDTLKQTTINIAHFCTKLSNCASVNRCPPLQVWAHTL